MCNYVAIYRSSGDPGFWIFLQEDSIFKLYLDAVDLGTFLPLDVFQKPEDITTYKPTRIHYNLQASEKKLQHNLQANEKILHHNLQASKKILYYLQANQKVLQCDLQAN
jgi:hypothetical protein